MSPAPEPVADREGRPIGCLLQVGEAWIAVLPSGVSRECGDRASALWWIQESAAGRDPERLARRVHLGEIGLLVVTALGALALLAAGLRGLWGVS